MDVTWPGNQNYLKPLGGCQTFATYRNNIKGLPYGYEF